VLDISDLLVGYEQDMSNIGDFVQLSENGGNTMLRVDTNGSVDGPSFQDVALLEGVTGLNLNDLLSNGNLDPNP
jgi:hypothetical protein